MTTLQSTFFLWSFPRFTCLFCRHFRHNYRFAAQAARWKLEAAGRGQIASIHLPTSANLGSAQFLSEIASVSYPNQVKCS